MFFFFFLFGTKTTALRTLLMRFGIHFTSFSMKVLGILLHSVWTRFQTFAKLFGAVSQRASAFLSDTYKLSIGLRSRLLFDISGFSTNLSLFLHCAQNLHPVGMSLILLVERFHPASLCSKFVILFILTKGPTFQQVNHP